MNENFVSVTQLNLLPERISRVHETKAAEEFYDYISYIYRLSKSKQTLLNRPSVLTVGAGGSYPAANIISKWITKEFFTEFSKSMLPQETLRSLYEINDLKYDLVIGVSYSGKSPDIIRIYEEFCESEHKSQFMLITGAKKEDIRKLYTKDEPIIISYFNKNDLTGKEKGVISMFSTLAPTSILCNPNHLINYKEKYQGYLEEAKKFPSKINIPNIADSIKKCPIIHLFYSYDILPVALDIESKFIESGLANVIMHEKKNFSHGRPHILYKQDFGLVINISECGYFGSNSSNKCYANEYEKLLSSFLQNICKEKNSYYLEFEMLTYPRFFYPPIVYSNIETLTHIPYFLVAIGENLGIDISKPISPYPEDAKELYSFKGNF